ncbi:hypothetical protein [Pseudactinotalea sp. Z1732]|uniref:hypothetical protein n=1 Tax=Micrococcales TaxID=85006 RepID=UPI003C7E0B7C
MRTVPIPEGLLRYTRWQCGLISTAQCRALGISADRCATLVARRMWQRVVRGVYDTEPDRPTNFDVARRKAAWTGLLAMGKNAIAVGCCALALHGVAGLPQQLTPEVAITGGRWLRGPVGVVVRRYRDVPVRVRYAGWQVSDVPTALVHALPLLRRDHGVAVIDSALNQGLINTSDLTDVRRRLQGRRGAARVGSWWPLVDGRAESPLETWARLDCHDHDLPPDQLQVVLRDATGTFIGRGDMGWRRRDGGWIIVEMDGRQVHSEPEALFRDRQRQNRLLAEADATILRFTSRDLRPSGTIANQVRQALTPTSPTPTP